MTHTEIASFICRLDCVLAPTKPKVLATRAKLKGKLEKEILEMLREVTGGPES